ncbi:DUF885 domain-containing protein [Actinoalloteichus hymeniacidonis]|uniref:DUF885 family protein n=1 Tax=Actinoalloteichus hymeniacidonis TaxID=340345 RepID=A0AAC9HLU2_9PSEU|nr:DUF885 domain-containing protein [Actinoalloteichus hymeniacidonis]AOS61654.1 hypothetical protein TL08_04120 [Actinoalloteichus hymeniacidonis]MBB5910332.1 hypothetical protein [Actinoalloteichus hymeniacidonis]
MDGNQLVREYLLLGLRFDRLVEGFVDAYPGDPRLRRQVDLEPRPEPAALARWAAELRARLPAAGLAAERTRFLDAQLTALECSGRRLAGQEIGFVDEVESYFQVRIAPGDTDAYRAVHADLAALLPGSGPLPERLADLRRRDEIPPHRLEGCVREISGALRERVRAQFGLPEHEAVEYEVVSDKPWSGFNYYLGDYRSRVSINTDIGHRMAHLPHLIAHESYPGHHTEHCRKEAGLVGRSGQQEQTIFLVNTPQCLMAEGMADLGLHAIVGPGWGRWTSEIMADLGLRMEGELVERVETVRAGLLGVRQDAALMLHDRGADEDEVVAFLRRWLLISDRRARQALRFLADPLWRAYTTTYVEGYRLLRTWLDLRPAAEPLGVRYARLLDEPLVPESVRTEIDCAERVSEPTFDCW